MKLLTLLLSLILGPISANAAPNQNNKILVYSAGYLQVPGEALYCPVSQIKYIDGRLVTQFEPEPISQESFQRRTKTTPDFFTPAQNIQIYHRVLVESIKITSGIFGLGGVFLGAGAGVLTGFGGTIALTAYMVKMAFHRKPLLAIAAGAGAIAAPVFGLFVGALGIGVFSAITPAFIIGVPGFTIGVLYVIPSNGLFYLKEWVHSKIKTDLTRKKSILQMDPNQPTLNPEPFSVCGQVVINAIHAAKTRN